jgi:hypothetical protein
MNIVTQNCGRWTGGKAVLARRKGVSRSDLIQERKVTRMNDGKDLWETAFLQMLCRQWVWSLRTAGEGSIINSDPGFVITGGWDCHGLGGNQLHFLRRFNGQLLWCACGEHPHSKQLYLEDSCRMLLWKIGIHLQDYILWKLAKLLNESWWGCVPDWMFLRKENISFP